LVVGLSLELSRSRWNTLDLNMSPLPFPSSITDTNFGPHMRGGGKIVLPKWC
jgi:hypothetical protein